MHTPLLWRLHAVHHAADDFNVVISIRHHPGTFVFYWIIVLSPALLGFSGEAMVIAMVVSNVHSTYVHTDLPTSTFLERWVFFGPHGHGIHHGANPGCLNMNFGDLVIWGRLFGTYKTDVPEPLVYGCEDPEGVYQSGRPLRDMVAVQISWSRHLWRTVASRLAPIAKPV
jgi:sterol desaturase/sphingolipid hydroxylase (fatty acid hydroxylase superfamily)